MGILKGTSSSLEMRVWHRRPESLGMMRNCSLRSQKKRFNNFSRVTSKASKCAHVNRSSDNYLPLANWGLSNHMSKSAKTWHIFFGAKLSDKLFLNGFSLCQVECSHLSWGGTSVSALWFFSSVGFVFCLVLFLCIFSSLPPQMLNRCWCEW